MSDNTGIEWTDATWNPVTGCTEVSPGYDNCYAKTFAERFRGVPGHHFERGFDLTLRPERLEQPMRWRKPRKVFVNSMSDLFHKDVPDGFIGSVWNTMASTPQHTYQILTKRPGRMRSLLSKWAADDWHWRDKEMRWCGPLPGPLPNVWLGVSVENQRWADIRVPVLLDTPAAVRFLSCEPLLGPVDLTAIGAGGWLDALSPDWVGSDAGGSGAPHPLIDWVIVGGESGHGARPMSPDWARSLRDQCKGADAAFLFKQWGEWGPAPWSVRIPNAASLTRDELAAAKTDAEAHAATHHIQPSGHLYEPDHKPWSLERDPDGDYPGAIRRWGKKRAGRLLDGRTWDEYPSEVTA